MALTFRQLQVFAEVARHNSFARAAEALHLTPPAVTMQVKELESNIGVVLFERSGRRVALTTAGEYFLVHSRRLLGALKEAEDAMMHFRKVRAGVLTVGIVSTAKYFVPRLLARFRVRHPGLDLRLTVSPNREGLVALLARNEVDLAIMGRPPREMSTRAEPFAAHPLVMVGPADHRVAGTESVALSALASDPFIVRESGSGTRDAMQAWFRTQRFVPRETMEMSSNETIKQAVMAGMGVSFLSLHTIGLEVRSGLIAVLPIDGTPVMRTWNVVRSTSKVLSPAAEAFRYFILEEGEDYLIEHDRPLLQSPA